MPTSIHDLVSSTKVRGDSLYSYYESDKIALYYNFTVNDIRNGIVDQFVKALTKNDVTPNTDLCLVFDSAGSFEFENILLLVAMREFNISTIHVILSDIKYANVESRPDIKDLPVTVEFVDGDISMLEAVKRIHADGYKVMLNALFVQKVFCGDNLIRDMVRSQEAHIQCMNMCLPYGVYFNYSDYTRRDSDQYSVHPICKNFTEYVKLLRIGCYNGVG